LPVREIEIAVTPLLELLVGTRTVGIAGLTEGFVKGRGVFRKGKRRSQIRAAAEPRVARAQIAQIHVNGRDVWIAHVGNQRYTARNELPLGLRGASNLTPCLLGKHTP